MALATLTMCQISTPLTCAARITHCCKSGIFSTKALKKGLCDPAWLCSWRCCAFRRSRGIFSVTPSIDGMVVVLALAVVPVIVCELVKVLAAGGVQLHFENGGAPNAAAGAPVFKIFFFFLITETP
jgi:hypothetical protein